LRYFRVVDKSAISFKLSGGETEGTIFVQVLNEGRVALIDRTQLSYINARSIDVNWQLMWLGRLKINR